jgi:hypothetical protein
MMNPKPWQRPLESLSIYMSKAKKNILFRSFGRIIRTNLIIEGRDSNLLPLGTILAHISNINIRMTPRGKTP